LNLKPAADAVLGEQIARLFGVWFQLLAQLADVSMSIVGTVLIGYAPHLYQNLLPGDKSIGLLEEV
jgi:hypothetical protein